MRKLRFSFDASHSPIKRLRHLKYYKNILVICKLFNSPSIFFYLKITTTPLTVMTIHWILFHSCNSYISVIPFVSQFHCSRWRLFERFIIIFTHVLHNAFVDCCKGRSVLWFLRNNDILLAVMPVEVVASWRFHVFLNSVFYSISHCICSVHEAIHQYCAIDENKS